MSQPFLGQLLTVPYNFSPRGWAFCNGQILPIAQNTALFSLLGTTYGGNGQTTFALPDLRGRSAIHSGQGPGLGSYTLGQQGGTETVTQTIQQMPIHNHAPLTFQAASGTKLNAVPAANNLGGASIYTNAVVDSSLNPTGSTANTGGSQPMPILGPYLALQWIIALEGIFPSRN